MSRLLLIGQWRGVARGMVSTTERAVHESTSRSAISRLASRITKFNDEVIIDHAIFWWQGWPSGGNGAVRTLVTAVSARHGDSGRRRPLGGRRSGRSGLSTQNRGMPQPSPVAASRITATNRCPRCSNHLPVSDSEDKTFFCPVCSLWVPTTARGDGAGILRCTSKRSVLWLYWKSTHQV